MCFLHTLLLFNKKGENKVIKPVKQAIKDDLFHL